MTTATRPAAILALALLAAGGGAARAETAPPDVTGTWIGVAPGAVSVGANPYRPSEGDGPYFSDADLVFTYAFTEQRGGRFVGTSTAGGRTETLIGAFAPPDFDSGIILDDDGRYAFTLRDAGTMDLCYDHARADSRVVACFTLVRE